MDKVYFNESDFYKFKKYRLSDETLNTESSIFYMPNNNQEIIKIYRDTYELNSKEKTIDYLERFSKEVNIPKLVIPNKKVMIDNTFRGIVIPKINGFNSRIYFKCKKVPIKMKIEILKQIGTLLEDIKIKGIKYNAALGDVHEDNFIVNKTKDGLKVYAIDTDSMRLLDNKSNPGYYLYGNYNISSLNKYEANSYGIVKPNYLTDIYSFCMIILEIISDDELIFNLDINTYKRYLDYLSYLGFDNNLLISLSSIYEDNKENINPLPYLDSLDKISEESSLYSFRSF